MFPLILHGPDLQNILRLAYDNARIITTFLRMTHLQNRKFMLDSVVKLAYDFLKEIFSIL